MGLYLEPGRWLSISRDNLLRPGNSLPYRGSQIQTKQLMSLVVSDRACLDLSLTLRSVCRQVQIELADRCPDGVPQQRHVPCLEFPIVGHHSGSRLSLSSARPPWRPPLFTLAPVSAGDCVSRELRVNGSWHWGPNNGGR